MKHFGDITKINGAEVPPVNVIIGGSPCQDLSVAGKREGLCGKRSSLFLEQLRIIKEMRQKDADRVRTGEQIRPRYMVWENVPGAFSSNKGADFGAVLQETIRIVCKESPPVPMPGKKWPTAGCLVDVDGQWSVAWRILDAQFWGVPQRRRRIALVADFGGLTAPEILFEHESVSGYYPQGGTPWERVASNFERGIDSTDSAIIYNGESVTSKVNASNPKVNDPCHTLGATGANRCYCIQGNCIDRADTAGCNGKGWTEDVSYTLNTVDRPAVLDVNSLTVAGFKARAGAESDIGYHIDQSPTILAGNSDASVCIAIENHSQDDRWNFFEGNVTQPLSGTMGMDGGNAPKALEGFSQAAYDKFLQDNKSGTLKAHGGTYGGGSETLICMATQQSGAEIRTDNKAPTLTAAAGMSGNNQPVCCVFHGQASPAAEISASESVSPTLQATKQVDFTNGSVVRRLTPLECERLQGFPDGWTDIGDWIDSKGKLRKSSDAPRYKALGNSIALPPWFYVLAKLTLCCGADTTMASLFDGIGGFPLIWETLNGRGTCIWASEIEEFPIAVTKIHFPDIEDVN